MAGIGTLLSSNSSGFAAGSSLGIDTTGGSLSYNSSIAGGMGLAKLGGNTLLLTGSDTYTGPTIVNQGMLAVNGSLLSPVTVNGGTLGGTGSLTSVTINTGGQLAPGGPLGVLNISGSLILGSGAWMDYDLDGSSSDDEIVMPNGLLALNGQQISNFSFTPQPGFGPGNYYLVLAGSISGSLGPSTSGTVGGYPATLAVQGDNLVLNVTPEPSTLVLLAAAAIGLAGYAWQRRRKRCSSLAGEAKNDRLKTYPTSEPVLCGQDETDLQADGPAVLSLPSRGTNSARRAA